MTTTTANKTQGTTVYAAASVANAVIVAGSAIDVSSKFAGVLSVSVGRTQNTAYTNEIGLRIQGAFKAASDDSQWQDIFSWTTSGFKTASDINTTTSGTNSTGQKVLNVASGTSAKVGEIGFVNESGAYEWFKLSSVSTNALTMVDNLQSAHSASAAYYNRNERYAIPIDLSPWSRIRLVIDTAAAGGVTGAAAAGAAVIVEALLDTLDSVTTT